MRIWIGHYLGDPEEWFMFWGDSKEDAIHDIDAEYGEPDVRSFIEIDRPGSMGLFAMKDEPDDEDDPDGANILYYLEPNFDNPPILERSREPGVEDWIKRCIEKPFGPPEHVERSQLGEEMGISQAEVMATYTKGTCPSCRANDYSKKKGCSSCGYKEPTV